MMAINTVPNPSDQSALKSKYPWMFQVIDDVLIKRSSLFQIFQNHWSNFAPWIGIKDMDPGPGGQ